MDMTHSLQPQALPFRSGFTPEPETDADRYHRKVGEALLDLMTALDKGAEYQAAVAAYARSYGIKTKDLREAYNEWTGVEYNLYSEL